jgi:hypothetical protein
MVGEVRIRRGNSEEESNINPLCSFFPHYCIFQIERVEIEFEKRFTVKPFRKVSRFAQGKRLDR